jgi:hypothetical protein
MKCRVPSRTSVGTTPMMIIRSTVRKGDTNG